MIDNKEKMASVSRMSKFAHRLIVCTFPIITIRICLTLNFTPDSSKVTEAVEGRGKIVSVHCKLGSEKLGKKIQVSY